MMAAVCYVDRENLNRDKYLLTQMDRDQWVPIQIVAGFNLVRKMTNRLELVVDVLRGELRSVICCFHVERNTLKTKCSL